MSFNRLTHNLVFFLYLGFPFLAFSQTNLDRFYTNTGDCGGDPETSYFILNRLTTIGLDFEILPDSVQFKILGIDSSEIKGYHCEFTPEKLGEITVSCILFREGTPSELTKTYQVIDQPSIRFEFIPNSRNSTSQRLHLRIYDQQSNKDVTADYIFCIFEFTLTKSGKKSPYFNGFGHFSIDLIALKKRIDHSIIAGDTLTLTYVKVTSPLYGHDFYYHPNIAYIIKDFK